MVVVFADTEKRFGRDTRVHMPTLDVTHKTSLKSWWVTLVIPALRDYVVVEQAECLLCDIILSYMVSSNLSEVVSIFFF